MGANLISKIKPTKLVCIKTFLHKREKSFIKKNDKRLIDGSSYSYKKTYLAAAKALMRLANLLFKLDALFL